MASPELITGTSHAGNNNVCIGDNAGSRAADLSLRRRLGVLRATEVADYCRESNIGEQLIERLLPRQSLSLLVGDSGLGKSPLLYQGALCVATGVPFLGHAVSKGVVLYLDFENGVADIGELVKCLSQHLGLTGSSSISDLFLWNYNMQSYGGCLDLTTMVREIRPVWTIIDSLTAYSPDIEERSRNAVQRYQEFRDIAREYGTAITVIHHIRKASVKPGEAPARLDEEPHRWFLQARGSGALVNACDVRIGIDALRKSRPANTADSKQEPALILAGFARIQGTIPSIYLSRRINEDGEPLGYERMLGRKLLFNDVQERTFELLPTNFRFKDAQKLYDRRAQATTEFLKKCVGIGIVRKDVNGYTKCESGLTGASRQCSSDSDI
jgi:hypothetical protein